jgi:pimeloyl-ACP methyl ester carboxylesterase
MMRYLVLLALLDVTACTASTQDLARDEGWRHGSDKTSKFTLAAATSPMRPGKVLWVYIEGDGLSYITPDLPSSDPTPKEPIALKLAMQQPGGPVAYLARPCQYGFKEHCTKKYWTSARYAPEVVESINEAVGILKKETGASQVALAGYSGGGALAVLVAARRDDVVKIVTVVANLDLGYWAQKKHITPLVDSLDPADVASKVAPIPQVHFTGGSDTVVGTDVVRSFIRRLPPGSPVQLVEVPEFTHFCCWEDRWSKLISGDTSSSHP